MAKAVLDHAHDFYDVGNWYVVAECWDLWAVQEELDRYEMRTQTTFALDASAICHFAGLIADRRAHH